MPVERLRACSGCGALTSTPVPAQMDVWHGECWLKELRRRWIAAPTAGERERIKSIADEAKKYQTERKP